MFESAKQLQVQKRYF